ncbi:MAG: cupin domain-containing protein [Christensenellales bacterium]|jgi:hypothetical protein
MDIINRKDIPAFIAPGRKRWAAMGAGGAAIRIDDANVGFARVSLEYGPMEPHKHINEILYVLDAKDAYVRYGDTKACEKKQPLSPGDVFRMRDGEWHVFEFENPDGFLEILTFFASASYEVTTASQEE